MSDHAAGQKSEHESIPETGGVRFVRQFLEVNYFYVFSAVLMLLGCYLLMRSPVIKGSDFARVLWTWLILQGYEVMVIATAIIIVRHFSRLSDAMTLLIIELALLLDPTFFSNNFFTMLTMQSTAINILGFILVPIKLLILQRFLCIRLTPRMFSVLMLAALFAYLLEGPLNIRTLPVSHDAFYYLLGWVPFILAFLLPPLSKMVSFASPRDDFITARQREWLPRFLLVIPMIVVVAHYIESSAVYNQVRFYYVYGAPLLLAISILISTNIKRTQLLQKVSFIDIISVLVLVISIGSLNQELKSAIHATSFQAPIFIRNNVALLVTYLAVIIVYLYVYQRLSYRPALYRIALLLLIGFGALLFEIGVIGKVAATTGKAAETTGRGIEAVFSWLGAHPLTLYLLILIGLLGLCYVFRHLLTWFPTGVYAIITLFYVLPLKSVDYIPEIVQCSFLLIVVLYHYFKYKISDRYAAVFILLAVGLGRFIATPAFWSGAIVVTEFLACIVAGILLKYRGFITLATIQAAGFFVALLMVTEGKIPPSVIVVIAALLFFAAGIIVTFRKQTLLDSFEQWSAAAAKKRQAFSASTNRTHLFSIRTENADKEDDRIPEKQLFEQEEEGSPGEETTIPPSVSEERREKTRRHLETVFVTDPEDGVFKAQDVEPEILFELGRSLMIIPSEEYIEVLFTQPNETNLERWTMLLTDRRLLFRHHPDVPLTDVYYNQIASISRMMGTLYIKSHSGQIGECLVLTAVQARFVRNSVISLIADMAPDQTEEQDRT